MKAIILAAGYGTRLYKSALEESAKSGEYAKNTPKALLEIGNKPLLNFLLERLEEIKIDQARIISNEYFKPAFEKWKESHLKKFPFNIEICYNNSTTWGDNRGAVVDLSIVSGYLPREEIQNKLNMGCEGNIKSLDDDCVVLLGDRFLPENIDLEKFYQEMQEKDSSIFGLYDTKNPEVMSRKAQVKFDENYKITYFKEKSKDFVSTINCPGPYFLKNEDIKSIKDFIEQEANNRKRMDAPGNFVQYLFDSNKKMYGIMQTGEPYDLGLWKGYKHAEKEILNKHL